MSPSSSGISAKAIGWALLSQLFWVPLLAIDLHERWLARQRDITPPAQLRPPSLPARSTPFSLNDLLGAALPVQQLAGQADQSGRGAFGQDDGGGASGVGMLLSSAGFSASPRQDRPFSVSLAAADRGAGAARRTPDPGAAVAAAQPINSLLGRAFTRAQLLGGSISLADLQEGPMAPLALAERALQRGSGDPLAPLPALWREPMRQALLKLPGAPLRLSPARMVIVPSRAVSQPLEVPLALQSDGSIDILEAPANAAVLREIDAWARQQRPPASGFLLPVVVQLHPLSPDPPNTVAAISPADSGRAVASPARASVNSPHGSEARLAPAARSLAEARTVLAPPPVQEAAVIGPPITSETPAAP